jgi:hypothetical protein
LILRTGELSMNKLVPMLVGALALLSGSAIAADMSVMPVKAPPEPALAPSGYVDLSMGGGRFQETFCAIGFACDPISSNTGWSIGGAGRGNWWLGRSVSLQLDAQAEGTQYTLNTFGCTTCGNRTSTTAYDIIAHLAWRDPRWAFGAMAAVGDVSPGVRTAAVGPEGLVNLGMFTLYAQGGWTATVGRNAFVGNDISGGFVRGTARFYPTQNILLEGTVQGAWLTEDPFDPTFLATHDIQSTIWRVKAEGMVNPWLSVYAAYQGSRTRLESGPVPPLGFGFDETLRDDRFVVGIRAWLGRDNLRNNDITGAPFDFINPINFFGPFAGMS